MSDLFKNNSNIINGYNSTKNESLEVSQPVRVRKKNRTYANVSNELNAYKKYLLGICHTFYFCRIAKVTPYHIHKIMRHQKIQ